MSLRLRVTLFIAVAVAAAVVAVSWAAYASARQEARSEIDQALLGRVAPLAGPGAMVSPPEGAGFGDDSGVAVRPDVLMQFVDTSGTVFAPASNATLLPVEDQDLAVAAGEGDTLLRDVSIDGVHYRMVTTQAVTLRAVVPGQPGQLVPVAVQVARDLTETDAFLGGLRARMLLIGGGAVLAAGVAAWFVSRRAVQPVARLTEAAEHVAATRELEVPIRVSRRDEIGRLAASFNSMLGALASSRAQQRRLVADAGHELRTPLTSLRTNMELLARAPNLPTEDRAEVLSDARHELEELSALVGELLDLAADAPPEDPREVRLDEVVSEAVERFRRRTGREVALEAEAATVNGRPGRLARAVANLLDNAHKWSPPEVAVEVSVGGGRVQVRDHGPGIDPADLPHVFERFYRAAASRGTSGSGLGLAIVQQVAEEHGGSAFASTADGGGALVGFTVRVPEAGGSPAGEGARVQEMPSA